MGINLDWDFNEEFAYPLIVSYVMLIFDFASL